MGEAISEAVKPFKVDFMVKHSIDLESIQELPEAYTWTKEPFSKISLEKPLEEEVPVIDLSRPDAMEKVGWACQKWGLFLVRNHGVEMEVLEEMEEVCRELFKLPIDRKMEAARSANGLGGFGRHRSSKFFDKIMWSEGFTIVDSPVEHASKLWPRDYHRFCNAIEKFKKSMKQLSGKLMWLAFGALNIHKQDIEWILPNGDFNKKTTPIVQLNSYPTCPDPDHAMGLAPHTDSTLINIVYQGRVSGLEVYREEFGWVGVPFIKDALAVNVGDLLHILSNGLYKSAFHRVLTNLNQHRVSLTYLHGPPDDIQISPLCKVVAESNLPARYPAISWSEYLKIKQQYFSGALAAIRI